MNWNKTWRQTCLISREKESKFGITYVGSSRHRSDDNFLLCGDSENLIKRIRKLKKHKTMMVRQEEKLRLQDVAKKTYGKIENKKIFMNWIKENGIDVRNYDKQDVCSVFNVNDISMME